MGYGILALIIVSSSPQPLVGLRGFFCLCEQRKAVNRSHVIAVQA